MKIEFRASAEGVTHADRTLRGVILRYGDVAQTRLGAGEVFDPGAFGPTLDDVILNVQHDRGRPIARTGAGLTLLDDPLSLRMVARLPETREADEALAGVDAGIWKGLSVEFVVKCDVVENRIRRIVSATLLGIGLVDRPAYPQSVLDRDAMSLTDALRAPYSEGVRVWEL